METTNLQIVGRDNSGYIQTVDVQSVDKRLFGGNGTLTGINIYQIQPKVKQLVLSGQSGTSNTIIGYGALSMDTLWGISKPKTFYASINYPGTRKIIYYDYIDVCGNERSMSFDVSASTTATNTWYEMPLQTGFTQSIAGINNFRLGSNTNVNDVIIISTTTGDAGSPYSMSYKFSYTGVLTCPNNAIMYITNISTYCSARCNFAIYKYDAITGARKGIFYMNINITQYTISAGADGCIGGYIYPGEAIAMVDLDNIYITAFANVVIKYLS